MAVVRIEWAKHCGRYWWRSNTPLDHPGALSLCLCTCLLATSAMEWFGVCFFFLCLLTACNSCQRTIWRLLKLLCGEAQKASHTWEFMSPNTTFTLLRWPLASNQGRSMKVCHEWGQTPWCHLYSRTPHSIRLRLGLHLKLQPCLVSFPLFTFFQFSEKSDKSALHTNPLFQIWKSNLRQRLTIIHT